MISKISKYIFIYNSHTRRTNQTQVFTAFFVDADLDDDGYCVSVLKMKPADGTR